MPKLVVEEGQKAQEQQLIKARELYKQEKFKAALFTYNKAMQSSSPIPSKAFDGRAAAHIKLRDYPAALKDAKQVMKLSKNEVKGYLRTAQVLQLMEKTQAALRICQYGLEKVPSSDVGCKAWFPLRSNVEAANMQKFLEAMREQLLVECAPKAFVDPMTHLPSEIVDMVLELLPFCEMVHIRRVSKPWRRLLESKPRLWRHLDLLPAKKHVSKSFISTCMRCSKGTMSAATLRRLPTGNALDNIYTLTNGCRELRYLRCTDNSIRYGKPGRLNEVGTSSRLTTLIIDDFIEHLNITWILNNFKLLMTAEFHNVNGNSMLWPGDPDVACLRLQNLVIEQKSTGYRGPVKVELESLILKAPNLKKLHLHRTEVEDNTYLPFNELKELEDLSLTASSYAGIPLLPGTLRNLCLSCDGEVDTDYQGHKDDLGQAILPHLENLETSRWCYPKEWFKHLLSTSKGNLRRLAVPEFGNLGHNIMSLLDAEILRPLEILRLPGMLLASASQTLFAFGDCDAERLAREAPNLLELDLSQTLTTGVGIKALVQKAGKSLKLLEFYDCGYISFDAVTYARKNGIIVMVKGEIGGLLKGKKVRNW